MRRSKLKIPDARQEPGTEKKKKGDVCMCFISEVLESHVGENSTAGVVKTQVGHIREGL